MSRHVAALAVVLAMVPAVLRADDAADIRATLERWRDDFNAGRADAACGLFADDVVAMVAGAPERDHAGVCAVLQKALAKPEHKLRYALDVREIIVSGDLAVVRPVWTLTVGEPVTATSVEIGMDIFRRQPDGAWKIIRYTSFEVE
jgi:steroid delta-isomerase